MQKVPILLACQRLQRLQCLHLLPSVKQLMGRFLDSPVGQFNWSNVVADQLTQLQQCLLRVHSWSMQVGKVQSIPWGFIGWGETKFDLDPDFWGEAQSVSSRLTRCKSPPILMDN